VCDPTKSDEVVIHHRDKKVKHELPPSLREYYTKYYPFDSILTMIKMTRSMSLLQFRDLGLQPFQNEQYDMKKRFNRVRDESLKEEMIKNNIPALHMGSFRPLPLQDYHKDSLIIYDKHGGGLQPELSKPYKEMIFDIDITDYDRFCSCREVKRVCRTCWLHMEGTCLILNDILTSRYGVKQENIMWIFSGGKGVHCFVNDSRMLKMSESQRMNLYNDIHVDHRDDYITHCNKYHYEQAYSPQLLESLRELFQRQVLCGKRNLLSSAPEFEAHILKKFARYYSQSFHGMVRDRWRSIQEDHSMKDDEKSLRKWLFLEQFELSQPNGGGGLKPSLYIILSLYYPMIDKAPLRLSHLIKLPFSIHTKTGKISLPVNQQVILNYDVIERFPTLDYNIYASNRLFQEGKDILKEWITHYH
jgi:DNA primase small subunit